MKTLDSITDLFSALADPTRLRLLNLMLHGEICVCFLVETLEEPQPKVSRHLAYLRRAGLVEVRREGKWMHYRIAELKNEDAGAILDAVRQWLEKEPQMKRDRGRLRSVCCAPSLPAALEGAPKPVGIGSSNREGRP